MITRTVLVLAALVVAAVVVVGIVAVGMVRRPMPQTSGELTVAALDAAVDVRRDTQGIPHIYADTPADLFRAQGYVAAQDRFFEMDLRRHLASGRLAELVGADGLDVDKVVRTLGWRRVAEKELLNLTPATRSYLEAYAEGVNDFLAAHANPAEIALEYTVLGTRLPGYQPERWSAVDSLVWFKAMAWDLKANYANELDRARLAVTVRQEQLSALYPPYPYDVHAPILSAADWRPGTTTTRPEQAVVPQVLRDPALARLWGNISAALDTIPVTVGRGDGVGSNSWVVGPEKSSTGHPLLANDPHLGTSMPGVWTQVGLHCRTVSSACPFDVSGFTFAGVPGVVIGHNQHIAWGVTNLAPDVTDFYLERVVGSQYERDGKLVDLTTRTETIKVAGGQDVSLPVRETVHGPIVSGVIEAAGDVGRHPIVDGKAEPRTFEVSLAWTGLVASQVADAVFQIDTATDFASFRAAAKLFAVPAQNLVYADTAGHIAYQAPGLIPVRRSASPDTPPGYWPAPGWDSAFDWTGWVPFEDLPAVLDPPEGYLVAANQAVTKSVRPFLTSEWDYGYRSDRIGDLLQATTSVTPQDMAAIQLDTTNTFAPTLVKALLAVDLSEDPFTQQAQELLRTWDFSQPTGPGPHAAAAAYYTAVWATLLEHTFSDEAALQPDGGGRWMSAVGGLLKAPTNPWWDDKRTPGLVENEREILRLAMVDARLALTKQLGNNPSLWEWGRLHTATLKHTVLGQDSIPSPVRNLFTRGPLPVPGGSAAVNAMSWNAADGYAVLSAPSMRMVVDLGNLDGSRWVNQTGQSGHPFTPHYDDQVEAWATGQSYAWPFSAAAVEAGTVETLRLLPSSNP